MRGDDEPGPDEDRPDPSEIAAMRELVERHGGDVAAAHRTDDPNDLISLGLDAVLVPGGGRYTLEEVAELAGVEPSVAQRLWRAMGFPDPPKGERIAGELDVEALRRATAFMFEAGGIEIGRAHV